MIWKTPLTVRSRSTAPGAPGLWREQVNTARLGKRRYLEPGKLLVEPNSLVLLSYHEA